MKKKKKKSVLIQILILCNTIFNKFMLLNNRMEKEHIYTRIKVNISGHDKMIKK